MIDLEIQGEKAGRSIDTLYSAQYDKHAAAFEDSVEMSTTP